MKKTLLTLTTFFTAASFACPDLSGNWQCENNSGQKYENEIRMIKGSTTTKITIIHNKSMIFTYHANGKPEMVKVGPLPMKVATTCTEFGYKQVAQMVNAQREGTVTSDINTNLELISDSEYVSRSEGTFTAKGPGVNETWPMPEFSERCTRL